VKEGESGPTKNQQCPEHYEKNEGAMDKEYKISKKAVHHSIRFANRRGKNMIAECRLQNAECRSSQYRATNPLVSQFLTLHSAICTLQSVR
jgi:hypothetical protein